MSVSRNSQKLSTSMNITFINWYVIRLLNIIRQSIKVKKNTILQANKPHNLLKINNLTIRIINNIIDNIALHVAVFSQNFPPGFIFYLLFIWFNLDNNHITLTMCILWQNAPKAIIAGYSAQLPNRYSTFWGTLLINWQSVKYSNHLP